jgi:hypothetical protein
MSRNAFERSRYDGLRRGRRTLMVLAPLVQVGFLALGVSIFLERSRALLSDAQFTDGERLIMGIVALVAIGGCGFAGWAAGRLIKVGAELIDVLADTAEAAWRTSDLIEQRVVPALGRIALALESRESPGPRTTPGGRT